MNKFTLGVALAALAAGGAAYALEAPDGGPGMGGRTITRAEAETRIGAMFDKLDANRDGKLDPADRAAHGAQMFDRIDSDHNGQISRAEFAAFHDQARDGEPGPPPPGMGGDRMAPGGGDGHRGHHGRGHGPDGHGGGMMLGRMADANGDGVVTRAEFIAAGLQRFDRADANHDGTLSPAEQQAAHHAMGGQMGERWDQHGASPSPSSAGPAPR